MHVLGDKLAFLDLDFSQFVVVLANVFKERQREIKENEIEEREDREEGEREIPMHVWVTSLHFWILSLGSLLQIERDRER